MSNEPSDKPNELNASNVPKQNSGATSSEPQKGEALIGENDSLLSADDAQSAGQSSVNKSNNNADAQILAHRHAHQQKLKNILYIATSIAVLVIAVFGINLFMQQANTESPGATAPSVSLSEQQIEQYREDFKRALVNYEVNVQPLIEEMRLGDWRQSDTGALGLLKEQVLTNFAQGAFAESKNKLEKLQQDSESLILEFQNEMEQHLNTAQQFFEQGQIPQAQLALNKVIAMQSLNKDAQALQTRIDAFGQISALIADFDVAKVERNLPKQIEVLSDITELDPSRTDLSQELKQLKTDYRQEQLAAYLAQAQEAVEAGQLSRAQTLVNQAKAVNNASKGAQALQTQINQMLAQQGLSQTKQQIKQLAEDDRWQEVASLVTQAKQQHGNDSVLVEYEKKASSVLAAKQSIAIFVNKPERLADQNIRDAAQKRIQEAISASIHSPSLQADIMQAANTIDKYAEPVELTVQSDGETYIIVVGVGHVGQHQEKVIELTPGSYVLEGRRQGYRNKRLEVEVKANKPLSVFLVCDESLN